MSQETVAEPLTAHAGHASAGLTTTVLANGESGGDGPAQAPPATSPPEAEAAPEQDRQAPSGVEPPGPSVFRSISRHPDPNTMLQAPTPVYKLYGELAIYSGNAHPELAQSVATHLGMSLGGADVFQFANTNTFCRLHRSVRGKDVFVIQPTSPPTNNNLMELLIFIDTLRRDSAGRITAIVPYYGYGRTDKKDQPRVPITARLVADLITVAGADRFLTLDLHAGQIQGFFTIPTDELPAVDLFVNYFQLRNLNPEETVVVAPDTGGVRRARKLAVRLGLPLAIIEKRRAQDGTKTKMFNVIGDVADKDILIVDDEIDTAGTLCRAAKFLRNAGARELQACATHAILSDPAAKRIAKSEISRLVITDTVPIPQRKLKRIGDRLEIISVAPLLADVIRRIHEGESVGELFDE